MPFVTRDRLVRTGGFLWCIWRGGTRRSAMLDGDEERRVQYRFVTEWLVEAPIESVFYVLQHSETWPQWWRGVTKVEQIAPGDDAGIGNVRRYTFKSRLPYRLTFDMRSTRIEPPHHLEGAASGELAGTGRWSLEARGEGVHVRYEWDVETTRWWMNLLGPAARPIFTWNHDVIMRWGEDGLRTRLGLAPRGTSGGAAESSRRGLRSLPLAAIGTVAGLGLIALIRRRRA